MAMVAVGAKRAFATICCGFGDGGSLAKMGFHHHHLRLRRWWWFAEIALPPPSSKEVMKLAPKIKSRPTAGGLKTPPKAASF
ncbi:hypothetical protein [Murdochiella vaginalis]|uniref:hypothetical protein n=1 Tax=Murdochiella vaginalis TaxID=1852373 RepID=UPI0011C999A6|nr:hypothetical protein [Murdochiella vaginalis]